MAGLLPAACGGSGDAVAVTEAAPAQADPVAVTAGTSVPVQSLDVQGHRGARGLKPENTLPAFEVALDLGVTTLELDLHFTADGEVVVWHDPVIEDSKCSPAVDPAPAERMISRMSYAEVETFVCDRNPDPATYPQQNSEPTAIAADRYGIVTLDQLFDFVDGYARNDNKTPAQREGAAVVQFNVETKRKPNQPDAIGDGFDGVNAGPFELAILEIVRRRNLADRVVIQSFDHRSLWAVQAVDPDIRLAALTTRGIADPAGYAARGATIWSPNFRDLTPELMTEAHDAGLLVIPWTVNDPADVLDLVELGVDGLITDRPDLVLN